VIVQPQQAVSEAYALRLLELLTLRHVPSATLLQLQVMVFARAHLIPSPTAAWNIGMVRVNVVTQPAVLPF